MGESGYLILNFQIKFPWKFKWAFLDIYKYPETPILYFHGNLEGRKRIYYFMSYCIPSQLVDWLGGFIIWHIWVCDFSFPEKWPPKHQSSGTKNEPPPKVSFAKSNYTKELQFITQLTDHHKIFTGGCSKNIFIRIRDLAANFASPAQIGLVCTCGLYLFVCIPLCCILWLQNH